MPEAEISEFLTLSSGQISCKNCNCELFNFISDIIDQCGHRRRADDACGLAFFISQCRGGW